MGTNQGDWDVWSMRKDERDLFELAASTPVLGEEYPALVSVYRTASLYALLPARSAVSEPMGDYHSGSVSLERRHDNRGFVSHREARSWMLWNKVSMMEGAWGNCLTTRDSGQSGPRRVSMHAKAGTRVRAPIIVIDVMTYTVLFTGNGLLNSLSSYLL